MGEAGGRGRWERPVGEAGGRGRWERPVSEAGWQGWWERPLGEAIGQCDGKGHCQCCVTLVKVVVYSVNKTIFIAISHAKSVA